MTLAPDNDPRIDSLVYEHRLLLRLYGDAQRRCSRQIGEQAAEIERLQAEVMRLRGRLIERDSRLWLARQPAAGAPAPEGRLLRQARQLKARLVSMIRTRLGGRPRSLAHREVEASPLQDLSRSLAAAELVICQTGCLSHKDYWRVRNACRRTGKTCVLVTDPEALRRIGLGRHRFTAPPAARDVADG